jgi:hypothetical protein
MVLALPIVGARRKLANVLRLPSLRYLARLSIVWQSYRGLRMRTQVRMLVEVNLQLILDKARFGFGR